MLKYVLIVNGDVLFRRNLSFELEQAGYVTSTAANAEDAVAIARRKPPHLILLAVHLPDLTGFEALKQLKALGDLPVIFLTNRYRLLDEILGLELGADDFLLCPVVTEVLLARMQAILRRYEPPNHRAVEEPFVVGDLALDPLSRLALLGGQPLELSPREFDLLLTFARHPHTDLSYEDLLTAVWGPAFAGDPEIIYVQVHSLRDKIETDPAHPQRVITMRGVGYRFIPQEAAPAPASEAAPSEASSPTSTTPLPTDSASGQTPSDNLRDTPSPGRPDARCAPI